MNEKSINLIRGKALYSTNGAAREYAPVGCNFFVGCSNGCNYCYLRKGVLKNAMGMNKPQLKKFFKNEKHAFEIFQQEATQNLSQLRQTGIFFSFSTDPLLPECQKLTWYASEIATLSDIPVMILTKSTEFFKEMKAYLEYLPDKQKSLVHFGFTLTGHDDWEPNAPSNEERIVMLKRLHDWGYHTFVSIEPIIDFKSSLEMIRKTKDFCEWYGIGLMTKNGHTYDLKEAEQFHKAVTFLLPQEDDMPVIYWKESFKRLCSSLFKDQENRPMPIVNTTSKAAVNKQFCQQTVNQDRVGNAATDQNAVGHSDVAPCRNNVMLPSKANRNHTAE